MKCSLDSFNFLEEICSLSHSIVFLYFFTLITDGSFLTFPRYSLELCIQMDISFLFSFAFTSLLVIAICKESSDNYFAFLDIFFLGMVLIPASCTMSRTSFLISSGTLFIRSSVQFSSVAQSCLTLCNTMNRSMPGLPVHHQLSEFTQTHVHRVGDAIQLSHPLSSPSPPAFNLSQHQGLF